MLGIVVNYYTKQQGNDANEVLVRTTALSLDFLVKNPSVDKVLLVDGSAESDAAMRRECESLGVDYYHDGQEISYVRAYNIGWKMIGTDYVGLMANDIIPHPMHTLGRLLEYIQKPDVGCSFPYFSTSHISGEEVQKLGYAGRGMVTCEPSSMTLNLNLFKTSVLEAIGGLDENYLFGYSEPILLIKIRSLGYRCVMVGEARVYHYDQLTKELEASSLGQHAKSDRDRWRKEYAWYASKRGLANIRLDRSPFSTTPTIKALWYINRCLPRWLRKSTLKLIMWMEPSLTRYPARWGKVATSKQVTP